MKDGGMAFESFMDPGHFGEEGGDDLWVNFERCELSRDDLRTLDANGDGQLDGGEFLKFVRTNPKVNQAWVNVTLKDDRCLTINANVHHNHTLSCTTLGSELRHACGDAQGCPDDCHTCRPASAWTPACGPKECHLEACKTHQDHRAEPAHTTPCAMGQAAGSHRVSSLILCEPTSCVCVSGSVAGATRTVVEIHASPALLARPALGTSPFVGGSGSVSVGNASLVNVIGWNDHEGAKDAIVNAARFWKLHHGNVVSASPVRHSGRCCPRPRTVQAGDTIAPWQKKPPILHCSLTNVDE